MKKLSVKEVVSSCCGASFYTQSNAGIENDRVESICTKCGLPILVIKHKERGLYYEWFNRV